MAPTLSSNCTTDYTDLKDNKKYTYIIYALNSDSSQIIVETKSSDTEYENFRSKLTATNECRWAVYRFRYTDMSDATKTKIIFFAWTPDGAKVKQKMVYASSKGTLRNALSVIHLEISGTDSDDVEYQTVLKTVKK